MQSKKFKRTIENFTCENCGQEVAGNGYTNHCPNCLYSKHVDINPGDRASQCGGLMKPIGVEKNGQDFFITHQCQKCGFQKKNKFSLNDNFDKLIQISKLSD